MGFCQILAAAVMSVLALGVPAWADFGVPKGCVDVSDLALGESEALGKPDLPTADFRVSTFSDRLASFSFARMRLRFVFKYSPAECKRCQGKHCAQTGDTPESPPDFASLTFANDACLLDMHLSGLTSWQ